MCVNPCATQMIQRFAGSLADGGSLVSPGMGIKAGGSLFRGRIRRYTIRHCSTNQRFSLERQAKGLGLDVMLEKGGR
jgi:hypothetical protein